MYQNWRHTFENISFYFQIENLMEQVQRRPQQWDLRAGTPLL